MGAAPGPRGRCARWGGQPWSPGTGHADLTWPEPQSQSSPASTKPFPQRASCTGSPGWGVFERHAPPPLRKKARSWRRLQALNTRGNGCLRARGGRRVCGDHLLIGLSALELATQ